MRSWKRVMSVILTFCMLVSMLPTGALALEPEVAQGQSYFDFEATEYETDEDHGEMKVKIVRHGAGATEAQVALKVVDFLAEYGQDYEVLLEDGTPMAPVEGTKVDPSQFTYGDETDVEEAAVTADTEQNEVETLSAGDTPSGEDKPAKERASTGSSLMDAQAAYLDLPENTEAERIESETDQLLSGMYEFFDEAQGAEGVVSFAAGEVEKELTVRIIDNEEADGTKLFMLALMGTDTEDTTIAPNASTYVTIMDDENVEPATFSITSGDVVLTEDNPTAEVTVTRSTGTQYFSVAYISTVEQSADVNAYENLEGVSVAFVPGQTEATATITAYDFSQGGDFGVRLEALDEDVVENHYITATIQGADGEIVSEQPLLESGEGRAAPYILGNASVTFGNRQTKKFKDFPGGWKTEVTGGDDDNKASVGDQLYVAQYSKGAHSMIYSNSAWNFTGVKNVRFSMNVSGDGSKMSTFFEVDSDQTFDGSTASYKQDGKRGWKEDDIPGVNKLTGKHYFKFAAKANAKGKHNPKASLDWFRIEYAKYTFSCQNAVRTVNRKLYDFTEGTPNVSDIKYDGESSRNYNPGTVKVTVPFVNVDGFYSNSGARVTISDANAQSNQSKGIVLKGVYFAANNISSRQMYADGMYRTSNVYYVGANASHQVQVSLNEDFVKTLIDKGVLSKEQKDETIKIYPVYGTEMVTVNFENTDRDDSNKDTRGKFDADHLNSYINNILQAHKAGKVTKCVYNKWLDYYTISIPKYSVVRVSTTPASNRTPSGVNWWYHDGSRSGVSYYKEGESYFTGDGKATITQTDFTKADIVVEKSMSMKPSTGTQTFYVGYSPRDKDYLPEGVTTLKNAVVDSTNGLEEPVVGSDENGSLNLENPYLGKQYSITAFAPDGYYTSWADMTGDSNNDGTIDGKDEPQTQRNSGKSSNPMYLYGNTLNVSLDRDRTRYYFKYVPQPNQSGALLRGTVSRENNTLLGLVNNQPSKGTTPIAGAYVSIAGSTTRTDGNGRYAVDSKGLPSWGVVSNSIVVGDVTYNSTTSIERVGNTVLSALEKFTARKVYASYSKADNKDAITKSAIKVRDDYLTIGTTVSWEGAITATKAHFYIYDKDGYQKVDCDAANGYTINCTTVGNTLNAELRFNPQQDMTAGDEIRVQFEDQNGVRYHPINVGYTIYSTLSLKEFVFPMIGSTMLEDVYNSGFVTDLIGDPLGGISLGSLSQFTETGSDYTPAGIPAGEADKYTWMRTDYTAGWSKDFKGGSNGAASTGNNTNKDGANANNNGANSNNAQKGSSYQTKGSFKWAFTPTLGFKLTLSQRGDQNYFEDLEFYAGVEFNVGASQTISTPVGISVVVGMNLKGDVSAIYRMYVDYQDSYETEDAVLYSAEDFGLFKKMNNAVRREGYIFLNPEIEANVDVGVGIIFVSTDAGFKFDMDFQFTEAGTRAYGDMTFDLNWGIKLVGFTVYHQNITTQTVKLFNTPGIDGHIEKDRSVDEEMVEAIQLATGSSGGELVLDQPSSRAYLENRGEWQGSSTVFSAAMSRVRAGISGGTSEKELRNGAAENMQISLTPINDSGDLLMVFVDDAVRRSDVNRRAVYYSIYTASNDSWSWPSIIKDDGTMDDYPNVQDLGNGKIFVSWSSAEKVLADGATVEDALKSLNIQAAFFDTSTMKFGAVETLTKTTDEDFTADVMPRAAYDSETDRLILYYTKTEYFDINNLEDIGKAFSATAYLFYENGKWSNTGDVYTDDELAGMTEAEKKAYQKNWYGQRFLDVRLDSSSYDMPRVVDSDAICYNGVALYTWTVDWDDDLNTTNDRDVFLQIYNFEENSFTHIIRITEQSGIYTTPKLVHSDNATYLFYGAKYDDNDSGEIKTLNISNVIKDRHFTKVTNGTNSYYVLEATSADETVDDSTGGTVTIPGETKRITADTVVACNNIQEFDSFVAADGKMYLLWTDSDERGRNIYAAILNSEDEDEDAADTGTDTEDSAEGAEWSAPVKLTECDDGIYYSGLGIASVDNSIVIVSGKNNYNDEADNRMVVLKHTPRSKLTLDDSLSISNENAKAGDSVEVVATLRNEGLDTYSGKAAVDFKVNGEVVDTVSYEKVIAGGTSAEVSTYITVPEGNSVEITAVPSGSATELSGAASASLEKQAILTVSEDGIVYSLDEYEDNSTIPTYSAMIENSGNQTSGETVFTAKVGDTQIGSTTVSALKPGDHADIAIVLDVSDDIYTVNEQGVGIAEITITAVSGDEELYSYTESLTKQYDANAIALLSQVTGVDNPSAFVMNVGDMEQLNPVIQGVEEGTMLVDWISSSDANVVSIDYSNGIIAEGEGEATLTGIVVPAEDTMVFDALGNATRQDWADRIPESRQIQVTANVVVQNAPVQYTNVAVETEHGSVQVDPAQATEGTTVTVTVVPEDGYELNTITAVTEDETEVALTSTDSTTYTFVQPASDVAVTAVFAEIKKYTNVAADAENGAIQFTPESATKGTTVFVAVDPEDGYELDTIAAVAEDGTEVELTEVGYVMYTFVQPEGSVTVTPVFKEIKEYMNMASAENGRIEITPRRAAEGEQVTVTAKPFAGYELDSISAKNQHGEEVSLTDSGDSSYTFTQPNCAVTVTATFKKGQEALPEVPFKDIQESNWFYDDVEFCNQNGLIKGVSNDEFAPDLPLTRAMFVTILYRAEGEPSVENNKVFPDVKENEYYTDAVAWAAQNNIVRGYEDGTFRPDNNISRQEMAVILQRMCEARGLILGIDNILELGYSDKTDVATWSLYGVWYCNTMKLMIGDDNNCFRPEDDMIRAEAAAVVRRFLMA